MISEEDRKKWNIEVLLSGDGVPGGELSSDPDRNLVSAKNRKRSLFQFRSAVMINPIGQE